MKAYYTAQKKTFCFFFVRILSFAHLNRVNIFDCCDFLHQLNLHSDFDSSIHLSNIHFEPFERQITQGTFMQAEFDHFFFTLINIKLYTPAREFIMIVTMLQATSVQKILFSFIPHSHRGC